MPPRPEMTFQLPTEETIFEAPRSIEVARITSSTYHKGAGPEILLYIRLECPNIQKHTISPPEKRKVGICGLIFCGKPGRKKQNNETAPFKWSCLLQAKEMQVDSLWFRIPACQQPTNGQIWARLMERRICLMVVLCGRDDFKSSNLSRQSTPSTHASFSLSDDEALETLECMLPTTYYFWDSGQFEDGISAKRSQINVSNDSVYLTLAAAHTANNLPWSDRELQMLRTGRPCSQMQTPVFKVTEPERKEPNKMSTVNDENKFQSSERKDEAVLVLSAEKTIVPIRYIIFVV